MVKNKQTKVLLTFDDGPTHYLSEILSILKTEEVQGLFFWQTRLVDGNQVWKQAMQEGHLVGTHGHCHRILTKLSYEEQLQDMKESKEQLELLTDKPICWFRPPFGLYNEETMKAAQKLQLEMVLWRVASWDWMHRKDEDKIIDNVLKHVRPGDIILLHELPQTISILSKLIKGIRGKGLDLASPYTTLNLDHPELLTKSKTS